MGQRVTDSLQRSAFTKGISQIRHLVEFARMLSELWRQTSSDATRREKSQPTAASLLLNSFHHGSRFPLNESTYYFTDFPRFIVEPRSKYFASSLQSSCIPLTFHLSRGALLDYHAPIGLQSSFPHPLPSLPPPCCKTSNPSKSFWI